MRLLKSRWTIIKITLIVILGYLLLLFTFHFCQGNEGNYTLGDDYWLNRWPGTLSYWVSRENREFNNPFNAKVTAYYFKDSWAIGKTVDGEWFAIEKKKHETYYPLASIEEANNISGIHFTESELITNPVTPWFPIYEYIQPQTPRAVCVVATLYISIIVSFCLLKKREKTI